MTNTSLWIQILRILAAFYPESHDVGRIQETLANVVEKDATFAEIETSLQTELLAQGFVLHTDDNMWRIITAGQEYLQRESTALETVEPVTSEEPTQRLPFDPDKIRVESVEDSVSAVLDQIEEGSIWIQPEFQRNFVWSDVRQSQLIESILLRIPLPAFYLDAERDDRLQVIDGLQRLSTLKRFCIDKKLKLRGLQYLTNLEGATYDDLTPSMRQIIMRRTRLTLYTIRSDTPKAVKFEIFSRVNRGGLTLTRQEIRHALYQGNATQLLHTLANDTVFLNVTQRSISPLRMDDQECVLRFLAFSLFPYTEFQSSTSGAPRNLDDLLNRTMDELNKQSAAATEQLGDVFRDSLTKAQAIFGEQAFRRFEPRNIDREKLHNGEIKWLSFRRNPINKPLFETWMVLLRPYTLERIESNRAGILAAFLEPLSDNDFINAITLGTGSQKTIEIRFSRVEQLLQQVLQ